MADNRQRYPITVPDNWSTHQVEAVLEFLDALQTVVYDAYEKPILNALLLEASHPELHDTSEDEELIPF